MKHKMDVIILEINPSKLPTIKELWEQAEAQNVASTDVLINMWKKYKDVEIENHFKTLGGVMIDGIFMFNK